MECSNQRGKAEFVASGSFLIVLDSAIVYK